ncbi:hypothetical protein [Paeniglutamicibacter cryotolerans]|uniref:Sensor domain-containing protein n=1 Tax=Paeniglutamicibacter cryotolerans TaxID=670079 RepID=A0A839QN03_9MICC|nr:hypothetical protein [Paeniglutamicibacter cryotolerans]MBB2996144.1 hypothetical protein [Paeniglutamicibacter cryotolerans]
MTDFTAPVFLRPAFKRSLGMSMAVSALGLALLLSGCSSGNPVPDPSGGTGTVTPPAELGKLDASVLEDVARTFAAEHPGSKMLDGAQIRAQIPATEKWLKTVVIEPERCGYYGGQSLTEQLAVAELAVVTLPRAEGQQSAQITVSSYREAETLVADISTQQYLDKDCGTFSVTSGGQTVKNRIEAVPVDSSAPYGSGILATATSGKKTTRNLTVRAVDGNVMVTSTRDAGSDVAAATQAAQTDVERMLELLRARG